jgi:hypothetical protein
MLAATRSLLKRVGSSSRLVRDIGIHVDEYVDNAPLRPAVPGIAVPPTISANRLTHFGEGETPPLALIR